MPASSKASPTRLRVDLSIRRTGQRLRRDARAVLSLSLSQAPAIGAFRPARKVACSACWRASSGPGRPTKPSNWLLGIGEPLLGRVLLIDALGAHVQEIRFERDPPARSADPPRRSSTRARPARTTCATTTRSTRANSTLLWRRRPCSTMREPHEAVLGVLDGAIHMPASELRRAPAELDTAGPAWSRVASARNRYGRYNGCRMRLRSHPSPARRVARLRGAQRRVRVLLRKRTW